MRPVFLHYLAQIWIADRYRPAQRDNPVREPDLLHSNTPPPSRLQIPSHCDAPATPGLMHSSTQVIGAGAIAPLRAGIRHTRRRPGSRRPAQRLWALLHAPSLLDGPRSAAHPFALPEDDYRRLAVRRQETRERRA
jgi:hypothetical protein